MQQLTENSIINEVEFRGKTISKGMTYDKDTWVYGCLFHFPDHETKELRVCINPGNGQFWVYPESVGMYIGKKDKNGNKIYTNSLVKIRGFRGPLLGRATHKRHNKHHGYVYLLATVDRYLGLHYNESQIAYLESPIADEKFEQRISYDTNLNRIEYSKFKEERYDVFEIDIEVIGNTIDDGNKSYSDLGFDHKIIWNDTYYGR